MIVNNNSYGQRTSFGAIMDAPVKKALSSKMKFGDLRQYVNLKHEQQANPYNVKLGECSQSGKLFGEIWEPNSSFIRFVDFQDKNVSPLSFIKSICSRANKENGINR